MVGHTMRKAFKKLDTRKYRERERKEMLSNTKLNVIDPSHELYQQLSQYRDGSAPSAGQRSSCYIHHSGLSSNPELHTMPRKWSSATSVSSLDTASIMSEYDISPRGRNSEDDIDWDLELLSEDLALPDGPNRRRSTGSARAKSQQKLAKILGWNTSSPQSNASSLKSPSCSKGWSGWTG